MIDGRMVLIIASQFFVGLVLFVSIFISNGNDSKNALDGSFYRETGAKLEAAGVVEEAVNNYQKYLELEGGSHQSKAKIAFSVASMYEASGKYEKALDWYYKVEILDKKAEFKADANKRIVALWFFWPRLLHRLLLDVRSSEITLTTSTRTP